MIASVMLALAQGEAGNIGYILGQLLFGLLILLVFVWVGVRIAGAIFRRSRDRWWVKVIGVFLGLFMWLVFRIILIIPQVTATP